MRRIQTNKKQDLDFIEDHFAEMFIKRLEGKYVSICRMWLVHQAVRCLILEKANCEFVSAFNTYIRSTLKSNPIKYIWSKQLTRVVTGLLKWGFLEITKSYLLDWLLQVSPWDTDLFWSTTCKHVTPWVHVKWFSLACPPFGSSSSLGCRFFLGSLTRFFTSALLECCYAFASSFPWRSHLFILNNSPCSFHLVVHVKFLSTTLSQCVCDLCLRVYPPYRNMVISLCRF